MITAQQLTKVLKAQSISQDIVAGYTCAEYVEVGIDESFAYFKVAIRNASTDEAKTAMDEFKCKTRFELIQEKVLGCGYVAEFKIAA